jgi:hypothetical protein
MQKQEEKQQDWMDRLITWTFNLIAKLAEPFLAFGLIASAIDYGSHGQFLSANGMLLSWWVATQAIALEGSGGVAFAMSFQAQEQNDTAKMWVQRILALSLMLVGGIMFFVEITASAKGVTEAVMPDWYIYLLGFLRAFVSIGYIAICRTKHYRYSGVAPQVVQAQIVHQGVETALQSFAAMVPQLVQQAVQIQGTVIAQEVQTLVQNALNAPVQDMQMLVESLPALIQQDVDMVVQQHLASIVQALEGDDQSATIQQLLERMQEVSSSVQKMSTTITEVRSVQRTATVDLQVQRSAQPTRIVASTKSEPLRLVQSASAERSAVQEGESGDEEPVQVRVSRYIESQLALGHRPTLTEIMEQSSCSKHTAIKYRRELIPEEPAEDTMFRVQVGS